MKTSLFLFERFKCLIFLWTFLANLNEAIFTIFIGTFQCIEYETKKIIVEELSLLCSSHEEWLIIFNQKYASFHNQWGKCRLVVSIHIIDLQSKGTHKILWPLLTFSYWNDDLFWPFGHKCINFLTWYQEDV